MKKVLINEKLDRDIASKGFVSIPLLTRAEVSDLLDKIKEIEPVSGFDPNPAKNCGLSIHMSTASMNESYRNAAQKLAKYVFERRIPEIFDNYKFLTGNVFVKPIGKGELPLHQNWHFTSDLRERTFSLWCPLVDVSELNGTIQLVESSHKILPEIPNPFCRPYYDGFVDSLTQNYSVPIELDAGSCLLFDDSLLHWSSVNRGIAPRIVIQALVVPSDSTTVIYSADPTNPSGDFSVYEISEESFTESRIVDLLSTPEGLRRLGFRRNQNRVVTEGEFHQLCGSEDRFSEQGIV